MDGEAFAIGIMVVIGLVLLISLLVVLALHDYNRDNTGSRSGPLPPGRQPIETVRGRPPARPRVPIETIWRGGPAARGIQSVVAAHIDRPLPAHARCGWCDDLISRCEADGRGPAVRCRTAGCDGVSCQACLRTYQQRCPGPCGRLLQ